MSEIKNVIGNIKQRILNRAKKHNNSKKQKVTKVKQKFQHNKLNLKEMKDRF